MASLRWRMMALLMIGSTINYLTRSTLGVAAPTILQDLHITAQQYSWIVSTFQGAIMNYPLLWDRQRRPKPAFAAVVDVLKDGR